MLPLIWNWVISLYTYFIFVHRVVGLDPGLYFLIRNEEDLADVKQNCHPYFFWKMIHDAPHTLNLYLLQTGDFRREATFASCQQDIAGDGAFSVGMIAKFKENIERRSFFYIAGSFGKPG